MELHAFDIMYIHGDIWLYELKGLGHYKNLYVPIDREMTKVC